MIKKKIYSSLILSWAFIFLHGQNYHAIQGSSFAGSIGVHNNPSSIVNTPYKWDVTVMGAQAKVSTNIVEIRNYSLLSPPRYSEYTFSAGNFERSGITSENVNLLNTRIALNRRKAIAFGANVRNYAFSKTSTYDFIDTLKKTSDFLSMNERNQPLGADFMNSGWIELYGSYAQTIIENEFVRLNAGISLKVSRGLSGAHASLQNGRFEKIVNTGPAKYNITAGDTRYGYSNSYDHWDKNSTRWENLNNFFSHTEGGASLDVGAELIIKTQAVGSYLEDDYFDYNWKLGLSVLDLGANQFKYGMQSRKTTGIKSGVTDLTLDEKFDSTVRSLKTFNDSLATIVAQVSTLSGKFRIISPTRLVLNADRNLGNNFYINAELSINLSAIFGKKWFYVKEMNVATLTPRWETRRWGLYMPLTYNTEKNFWIGGAFKAGPILFGLHNLAYIFSQKSIHKGGGYIAIIIRSPGDSGKKQDKQIDCPTVRR